MVKLVVHRRLKISRLWRAGSSPAARTKFKDHHRVVFFVANKNNNNMAYHLNTSGTSPGVTHSTIVPLPQAKRGLEGFREQLASRGGMAQDAVAVYRVTRLPTRHVYVPKDITVQPLSAPTPLIFSNRILDE